MLVVELPTARTRILDGKDRKAIRPGEAYSAPPVIRALCALPHLNPIAGTLAPPHPQRLRRVSAHSKGSDHGSFLRF
jgi:hypothetical protein